MEKIDIIKTKFPYADRFHDIAALGANQLVTVISNLSHKSTSGLVQRHLVSLETLVCTLLFFEVRRPHDIIYSLLAIARDTKESFLSDEAHQLVPSEQTIPITVDYDKDPVDIFIGFTTSCIEMSKSLDIICRHWAPDVENEIRQGRQKLKIAVRFPSWIQKLSNSSFGKAEDALRGRRGGDSLVGCPFRDTRKTYNAAYHSEAVIQVGGRVPNSLERSNSTTSMSGRSDDSHDSPINVRSQTMSEYSIDNLSWPVLHVKGIEVARIAARSDRITNGNIPAKWLRKAGWDDSTEQKKHDIPDKLWKTLVADRGPDGRFPPRWYKRACQHCLNDEKEEIMSSTSDLNTQANTASDIAQKFLSRVRSVVWNRQFFHATGKDDEKDERFFGLMPEKARKNDLLCILNGCTVPVILHEVDSHSQHQYYELVGETYVYGIMDGEKWLETNEEEERWFSLC
jgi:hypothetical protein